MTPGAYRLELDSIGRGLLLAIIPVLRLLFRPGLEDADTRRRRVNLYAPLITREVRAARSLVARAVARLMRYLAERQAGVADPFVPPLAGYSEQAVRTALERAIDTHIARGARRSDSVDMAGSIFVRHAENAGRQIVVDAVEPDDDVPDDTVEDVRRDPDPEPGEPEPSADAEPESESADSEPAPPAVPERETRPSKPPKDKRRPVAWARTLTGAEDCAFCVMLASRGAVYKSKATATGKESNPFEKYHDRCDCVAVPVYTSASWEGKAEADALYKFWLEATRGYRQGDAILALRRELARRKRAGEELYPGRRPLREAA